MNTHFFHGDATRLIIGTLVFLGALALVILLYRWIIRKLLKRTLATPGKMDDFIVDALKFPFLVLLLWIMISIFTQTMFFDKTYRPAIDHVLMILFIMTVGWILIKGTRILFFYLESKLQLKKPGNFKARGSLTKLTIFERMITILILIITVAVCLMTFDKIRNVGIGLLSSAGIAGIVIGFAAQKSLGSIMAGIQIAITQPIKLDDWVVVVGQGGNIEEINLTYVVVKLWDERRLILPISYFLDNPIENWTRNTSNITGSVYLYLDFKMPLAPLREKLQEILKGNPKWDGRTSAFDVTNMTDNHLEIRLLVSSENSGDNWNLQVELREKMVEYIQQNYPQYFVRTRINEIQTN